MKNEKMEPFTPEEAIEKSDFYQNKYIECFVKAINSVLARDADEIIKNNGFSNFNMCYLIRCSELRKEDYSTNLDDMELVIKAFEDSVFPLYEKKGWKITSEKCEFHDKCLIDEEVCRDFRFYPKKKIK